MNKFNHISSIEQIDAELKRIDTQKKLIKNQLATNFEITKEAIKPTSLILMLAQSITSKSEQNTLPNLLVRLSTEILTTVQATKFGIKLLKKLF